MKIKKPTKFPSNKAISQILGADIRRRLDAGAEHYEKADLDLDTILDDPRDWLDEAYDEALDLLFYLHAARVRRDAERL